MIMYIVQQGDTLAIIANRFNVSVQKIIENNWIRKDLVIYPGQILFIPRDGYDCGASYPYSMLQPVAKREVLYAVQRGDTLAVIARRFDTTVDGIVEANYLEGAGATIYPGQILRIPIIEFQ
ncbi:MAG: LysM peptidoglycan-binding domain-containing protein [Tepidanaerobacteraceae bacterium]|nr:LysM peptidoglycan-binding domain-containing protein [Tepidanaerobacteraceae bacterium]